MAWHEGKPEYRSSPNSKEVRENFAYLKAIADILSGAGVTQADLVALKEARENFAYLDILSGAGVTQADLVALRGASSAPGANKIAKFNSDGIMKGAELNMTGWTSALSNTSSTSLNIGTVTVGDVVNIEAFVAINGGTPGGYSHFSISYASGSAAVTFLHNKANLLINKTQDSGGSANYHISTSARVISSGKLVLITHAQGSGPSGMSYSNNQISAFFLRKN